MNCPECKDKQYIRCEMHNLSLCFNHFQEHLSAYPRHDFKRIERLDDALLLQKFKKIIEGKLKKVQKMKENILNHSNQLIKIIQQRALNVLEPFIKFQLFYTQLLKNSFKLSDNDTRNHVINFEMLSTFKKLKEVKDKILEFYMNMDPIFRYDFNNSFKIEKTEFLAKHYSKAYCAGIVENFKGNNFLVVGSSDTSIRAFDLESVELKQIYIGHLGVVISLAFTSDYEQMISGGCDYVFKIWDFESGILMQTNDSHHESVFFTRFIGNSYNCITAGKHKIILWKNKKRGSLLKIGESKEEKMISFALLSLKREILITSFKTIGFYSYDFGKLKKRIMLEYKNEGIFDLNPSETKLAFLTNQFILIYDFDVGEIRSRIGLQNENIKHLKFSVDEFKILICTKGNKLIHGDIKSNSLKPFNQSADKIIQLLAYQKKDALAKDNLIMTVLESSIRNISFMRQYKPFTPNLEIISNNNQFIIFASGNKCIVWSTFQKNDLETFTNKIGNVSTIAISQDSKWILTGYDSESSNLFYWKLEDSKISYQLNFHSSIVVCVCFSFDGKLGISHSDNNGYSQTVLWDLSLKSKKKKLESIRKVASAMIFFTDQKCAVAYITEYFIEIIDIEKDQKIHQLKNHEKQIQRLYLTKSKKFLISAAYYEGICIYDTKTLDLKSKFKTKQESKSWIYKKKSFLHQLLNFLI
jgi:WD40 repeat protein